MRGRKNKQPTSLWEVINKDRLKQSQQRALERISNKKNDSPPAEPVERKPVWAINKEKPKRKPRPIISLPANFPVSFPVLVVSLLIFLAIIVAAVKLSTGQNSEPVAKNDDIAGIVEAEVESSVENSTEKSSMTLPPYKKVKKEKIWSQADLPKTSVANQQGDHVIIITIYQIRRDLEPVVKFFANKGIETQIVKPDKRFYYLITKNKYQSPLRSGTDGFYALAKIKSVGAKYKAPKGYEPFGKVPFQDAYGINVLKSKLFKETD